MDAGRNGGVTIAVDLPGFSAPIEGKPYGFGLTETVETLPDAGRGDGNFTPVLPLNTSGLLVITFKIRPDCWPMQASFNGITASAVLTEFNTTPPIKTTCSILIHAIKINSDTGPKHEHVGPPGDTLWDGIITASLTGDSLWEGWGKQADGSTSTQPTTSQPSPADKVRYAEMNKTYDRWHLVDAYTYDIRVWGLTDNDSAEWSKLAQAVANQTPSLSGQKLRTVSMVERLSNKVSVLRCVFGRNDTRDDQINPRTTSKITPSNLQNEAMASDINNQPASPNIPNTELTTYETLKLDDGNTLVTCTFTPWNDFHRITLGGTFTYTDPKDLKSAGQSTQIYPVGDAPPDIPAPPVGLQNVFVKQDNISAFDMTQTVSTAKLNSEQEELFPKISTTTDLNNINSRAVCAQFWLITGSPPALPDNPPTGNVELVDFTDVQRTPTNGIAPGKSMRVWVYGPADSAHQKILEHYETTSDSNALQSKAIRACLDGSSNPSTVADAFGKTMVARPSTVVPITLGLGINRTLTVTEYAFRDTKDDEQMPRTKADLDAQQIESTDQIALVYATIDGPPSQPDPRSDELLFNGYAIEELNKLESVMVAKYSTLSSKDKRAFEVYKTTLDGNKVDEDAVRVRFWARGGTQPTAPLDPPSNNVKIIKQFTKNITSASGAYTGINMEVFLYGEQDSKDELILGTAPRHHYGTLTDVGGLESEATEAFFDGDSIPATLADLNGVTLYKDTTHVHPLSFALGTNRILYVVEYRPVTSQLRYTFPKSPIVDDFASGYEQNITSLVASDDSVDLGTFRIAQRNSLITANGKTYDGLSAVQFNKSLKSLELKLKQDSKEVRCHGQSRLETLSNVGGLVRVAQSVPRGSNGCLIRLAPIEFWRSTAELRVFRRFTVTTDPDDTLLHSGQWTTRNSSRVAGFNTGYLMFSFADFVYAGGLATSRPIGIEYVLAVDSLQFQPSVDTRYPYYSTLTSSPAPGDYVYSTLGIGAFPSYPTLSDLSFIFA